MTLPPARHRCPVCGHAGLSEPPRNDGNVPSGETCSSCGYTVGPADGGARREQWRTTWIDGGARLVGADPTAERWIPWDELATVGAFADPGPGPWTCPACGFPALDEPPRDTHGGASYDICPSCGFEPGYTDDDQGCSYAGWRERWVAAGMPWRSVGIPQPPPGWDPAAQLRAAGLPGPGDERRTDA